MRQCRSTARDVHAEPPQGADRLALDLEPQIPPLGRRLAPLSAPDRRRRRQPARTAEPPHFENLSPVPNLITPLRRTHQRRAQALLEQLKHEEPARKGRFACEERDEQEGGAAGAGGGVRAKLGEFARRQWEATGGRRGEG